MPDNNSGKLVSEETIKFYEELLIEAKNIVDFNKFFKNWKSTDPFIKIFTILYDYNDPFTEFNSCYHKLIRSIKSDKLNRGLNYLAIEEIQENFKDSYMNLCLFVIDYIASGENKLSSGKIGKFKELFEDYVDNNLNKIFILLYNLTTVVYQLNPIESTIQEVKDTNPLLQEYYSLYIENFGTGCKINEIKLYLHNLFTGKKSYEIIKERKLR